MIELGTEYMSTAVKERIPLFMPPVGNDDQTGIGVLCRAVTHRGLVRLHMKMLSVSFQTKIIIYLQLQMGWGGIAAAASQAKWQLMLSRMSLQNGTGKATIGS